MSAPTPSAKTFRLPALTYLVVLFLTFCVIPLALAGGPGKLSPPVLTPRILLLAVPVLAAAFIARWATVVSPEGITVRAVFGSRLLRWEDVRGVSVTGTTVYAVLHDGAVRLPCVRVANLAELARASGGHLPPIADPVPKFAPQRHRPR